MNIQALKLDLVEKILRTEKTALLLHIEKLLEKESEQDWWNQLPTEVQKSIIDATEDITQGRTFSHNQVIREAKQKYGF